LITFYATLPNNCIYRMAALLAHGCSKLPWSMPKKCNYLRRESSLKSSTGTMLSTKGRPGNPISETTTANTKCYVYVYIYTVFAIAVYLASTYTLIYTWSTNWRNESLCFKLVLGRDLCHSCTRIELRSNKPKTVHFPRTLIFHICSKEVSIIYYIHIQHYQLNIIDYKFYLLYYVLYILCSILYIICSLLYILLS